MPLLATHAEWILPPILPSFLWLLCLFAAKERWGFSHKKAQNPQKNTRDRPIDGAALTE